MEAKGQLILISPLPPRGSLVLNSDTRLGMGAEPSRLPALFHFFME